MQSEKEKNDNNSDKGNYDLDSIIEIISNEYFPNYLTDSRMYYLTPIIDKSSPNESFEKLYEHD